MRGLALDGLRDDAAQQVLELAAQLEVGVQQERPVEVGGLEMCKSPDLPTDLERWNMGWSEDEQTLYFNYYDSGFWLPWYEADAVHDDIAFTWAETLGFFVPEDDN